MRLALLQLAHLERESGNLPSAIDTLRHALKVNPGDAESASLLGAYLTAAGRSREAVEILQPYASATDADTQVLVALALAQARAGAFAEARRRPRPGTRPGPVERDAARHDRHRRADGRAARVRHASAFESALAINPNLAARPQLARRAGRRRGPPRSRRWSIGGAPSRSTSMKRRSFSASACRSCARDRDAEARPYLQLFVAAASPARYAPDIAKAREWLSRERR